MRTLLRLAGFRAALAYTGVLLVAMALVMGLLYGRLADTMRGAQDNLIWREAAALSFVHQRDGVRALAQAVSAPQAGQGSYVRLSDSLGNFLAGNLQSFPTPERTDAEGWVHFTENGLPVRARLLQLDDNLVLLVGHEIADGENLLAGFRTAFAMALLAILLIGLGGGAFLARRGLQRVEAIGDGLRPVMQGDLSARLPVAKGGAEWQTLESRINATLAQLEKLMHATRAVSDNLAHDLRAPLTRLRVRLETVLAKTDNDEIAAAIDDVDGLLKSFNALLTLSRLDSGIATLEAWPVNVTELMGELHDLFAPLFDDSEMRLELSCADNLNLAGDAGLLGQALVNLLENVLLHGAAPGSSVELAARQDKDKVVLSLADGGKGIASERRGEALDRFVQLDASRTKGGNGLGLSLVAAICAHHGGDVQLADNQPGLRVEMHLPVKA